MLAEGKVSIGKLKTGVSVDFFDFVRLSWLGIKRRLRPLFCQRGIV
jgi:hypothetical protein